MPSSSFEAQEKRETSEKELAEQQGGVDQIDKLPKKLKKTDKKKAELEAEYSVIGTVSDGFCSQSPTSIDCR